MHATINLRSRRELEARGYSGAATIHNFFDLDPPPGDRTATRERFGFRDDELVLLQPSRAIERKNVPGAVRLATHLTRDAPSAPCTSGCRDRPKTATTTRSPASSNERRCR